MPPYHSKFQVYDGSAIPGACKPRTTSTVALASQRTQSRRKINLIKLLDSVQHTRDQTDKNRYYT